MRFPRYLLSLCALVFFAVVVSADIEESESVVVETDVQGAEDTDNVEERNPLLLRAAIKIIQQAVKWAAKNCVKDAANKCKKHWKNPKNLVNCGKKYLQANKGRCTTG